MSTSAVGDDNRDFNEMLEIVHKWCIGRLRKKYPKATNEECVEAAMHGVEQLWIACQGDKPPQAYFAYALVCAENHLRKLLGNKSKHRLESMDSLSELPGHDPTPLEPVLVQERRARQSGAQSETLRQFVEKCEKEKRVGLRVKECFERRCFGEEIKQIADSMRQYRKSADPRDQVDHDLWRAGKSLLKLRDEHDVNRTLFTKMPLNERRARQEREQGASAKDKAAKPGSPPHSDGLETKGENPPLSDAALRDTMRLMAKLPEARSSIILFAWLVCETQAYCPSAARLQAFAQWHAAAKDPVQANCPDELLDIGYHVLERNCRFCTAELGLEAESVRY